MTQLTAILKRPEGVAMSVYFVFTLVALVGYATFGLNPDWLAGRPGLTAFYVQSFTLFGQGHVLIGAVVLGTFLVRNAGPEWLPAFVIVYIVSFLSEFVGTGVGLPFGHYYYTGLLGPQWFDRVPLLIPLSWFLMVLPAYVIVRHRMPSRYGAVARVVLAAVLFVIWDLSLDPAMSHLTSYWVWEEGGTYYGMPLINLGGWMLTALVLMTLMEMFAGDWLDRLSARWCMAFYGITLLMPLGMVFAAGLWLPVVLTIAGLTFYGMFLRGSGSGDLHDVVDGHTAVEESQPTGSDTEQIYRLVDERGAEAIFGHHARSFSFASRLFPARERRLIACLYAFCRTTDDLVDGAEDQSRDVLEGRLEAWRRLAHRSYEGEPSRIRWLDEIMTASARAAVPPCLIDELVDGVRMDIGRVNVRTFAELDAYSYRVASVVGIWKCYLAGVSDPKTLARAAAMGRAMQLTNILRDVGEDLDNGRIYLPAELRYRYGVTTADLKAMGEAGKVTPGYREMIEALMVRAEAEYERAFPGIAALPPAYARASAVAAEVYRGIHSQIRRNRYNNLSQRAYTGPLEKMYLALRGLSRLWQSRRSGVVAPYRSERRTARAGWSFGLFSRLQLWAVGALLVLAAFLSMPPEAGASEKPYFAEGVEAGDVRLAESSEGVDA